MKKGVLVLAFMTLFLLSFVYAEEDYLPTGPEVIDSQLLWHLPPWIPETKLLVTVGVIGDYKNPGDKFKVEVAVKNIGNYRAVGVVSELENVPSTWKVVPKSQHYGSINPGEKKTREFIVWRDENDTTIYAVAQAFNSRPAISEKVAIPISLIVVLASLGVFGILIHRRQKRNV